MKRCADAPSTAPPKRELGGHGTTLRFDTLPYPTVLLPKTKTSLARFRQVAGLVGVEQLLGPSLTPFPTPTLLDDASALQFVSWINMLNHPGVKMVGPACCLLSGQEFCPHPHLRGKGRCHAMLVNGKAEMTAFWLG